MEIDIRPVHVAIGAAVALAVMLAALIALLLLLTVAVVVVVAAAVAWLAWRTLPFRRHPAISKSPVERLTDHYVSGRFDLREFERRLSKVLSRP